MLVAVGVVFFVATVVLAASRLMRVSRVPADAGLIGVLKKAPHGERLEELGRRALAGSWQQRLAEEALAAQSPEARVAAINDVLGELEHELERGDVWAGAAVRLSVAWGLLLACLGVVLRRMDLAIGLAVLGAAAALAAAELGRRGRAAAQQRREDADQLVTTVLGVSRSTIPTSPSMRSRRRRPSP